MDLPKDKAQELLESKSRRNFLKATGSLAAVVGIASGQIDSAEDGNLTGGAAMLEEAYQVGPRTWMGPDSAKATVEKKTGRKYEAIDTNVQYYTENGEWQGPLEIGSETKSVPAVHTEDLLSGDRGPDAVVKSDGDDTVIIGPDELLESDPDPATALENVLSESVGDTTYRVAALRLAESISGLTSTVTVNVSPVISGRGWETTLEWDDGAIDGASGSSQNITVKREGTVLRDFKYDGGDPNNSVDGYGILFEAAATDCRVENVYAVNVPGDAFGALRDGTVVQSCRAETFTEGGVEIVGAASVRDTDLIGVQPIHLSSCTNALVSGGKGVCEGAMGNQSTGTVKDTAVRDTVFDGNGNAPPFRVAGGGILDGVTFEKVTFRGCPSGITYAFKGDNGTTNNSTFRDVTFEDNSQDNATVSINGDNNTFENVTLENSGANNIYLRSGEENVFRNINGTVGDFGTRTLIDGRGTNDGDPSVGNGEWAGHESYAADHNALIEDVTNGGFYRVDDSGSWVAV